MTFLPCSRSPRASTGLVRTVNLVVIGLAGIICVALPTALLQGQMLQAGEAQVYVAALRKDRPVMGLGPDDFRIEENGDRREVIRVEPAIVGFDLAVLVDDSMVGNNVVHFRQALRSFFQSMKGHRISLQTFGDERRTVVDYTTDLEPLLLAADEFTGFSETSAYLLRAIDETARELAVRRAARPMMVVVTTEGRGAPDLAIRGSVLGQGGRSTPEATRDQDANAVVDRLWAYGIGMHAVARTTPRTVAGFSESSRSSGLATLTSGAGAFRWMQENRERERVLDKGPNDTGGRLYKVSSTSGIEERLQRIANELSGQYLVTFHRPAVDEVPRKLKVRVNGQRLTVRATPSRVYIPPVTVYVVGGVVDSETVYHHSIACEGLSGGLVNAAVPVPLAALAEVGKMCPYCPGARSRGDTQDSGR